MLLPTMPPPITRTLEGVDMVWGWFFFDAEKVVGGGSGGRDEVGWFIVTSAVLLCISKKVEVRYRRSNDAFR